RRWQACHGKRRYRASREIRQGCTHLIRRVGCGGATCGSSRTCPRGAHLRGEGEAPLGIVYGTDAKSEPAVKVVGTFPENSHPRILYPVTLTASAKPEARKFVEFLLSAEAAPAFQAQGFSIEGKVGQEEAG